jgi:septum formation protein
MKIILASSSPYRAALLKKLCIPFECMAPQIDETMLAGESVEQQVSRLAHLKAQALVSQFSDAFIIGSDQLASHQGRALGKPGNFNAALKQLSDLQGQRVEFHTGLCLLNSSTGEQQTIVEKFAVEFKQLSTKQLQRYLTIEQPFDCAGSFKSEGLGITLFERLDGRDPNTLIGLPLIALIELFAHWHIDLFDYMQAELQPTN